LKDAGIAQRIDALVSTAGLNIRDTQNQALMRKGYEGSVSKHEGAVGVSFETQASRAPQDEDEVF
jgi:hypothetical protein